MGRLIRTIVETNRFSKQCEALGGAYRIDQALDAIYWILSIHPEVYPVLPGLKSTRLVTTERFETPEGVVPRLRVYFRILYEDGVELLWIEEDLERRGYEGPLS